MKSMSIEAFAKMAPEDQHDLIWEVRRMAWGWYEEKGSTLDCDCYESFPEMICRAVDILQKRYYVECEKMPLERITRLAGGMVQMVLNMTGPGRMESEDIKGAHPYIPKEIVHMIAGNGGESNESKL